MVKVDAGQIATWIGIIGAVGGFLIATYKLIRRIEKAEERTAHNTEENKIVIKSLFACLDGLHQLGANGEVTKARDALQEYVIEK